MTSKSLRENHSINKLAESKHKPTSSSSRFVKSSFSSPLNVNIYRNKSQKPRVYSCNIAENKPKNYNNSLSVRGYTSNEKTYDRFLSPDINAKTDLWAIRLNKKAQNIFIKRQMKNRSAIYFKQCRDNQKTNDMSLNATTENKENKSIHNSNQFISTLISLNKNLEKSNTSNASGNVGNIIANNESRKTFSLHKEKDVIHIPSVPFICKNDDSNQQLEPCDENDNDTILKNRNKQTEAKQLVKQDKCGCGAITINKDTEFEIIKCRNRGSLSTAENQPGGEMTRNPSSPLPLHQKLLNTCTTPVNDSHFILLARNKLYSKNVYPEENIKDILITSQTGNLTFFAHHNNERKTQCTYIICKDSRYTVGNNFSSVLPINVHNGKSIFSTSHNLTFNQLINTSVSQLNNRYSIMEKNVILNASQMERKLKLLTIGKDICRRKINVLHSDCLECGNHNEIDHMKPPKCVTLLLRKEHNQTRENTYMSDIKTITK